MNNQLSFPEKLLRCLYDMAFYNGVLKEKTSRAVKFGILVALFFGSLAMVRPLVEWSRTIDLIVQDMEVHLAEFTIENGVLVSESQTPYALNMDGLAIVVDPTGEETALQAGAGFGFYLTQTRMIVRNGLNREQGLTYDGLLKESFGKEDLQTLIGTMKLGGLALIPLGALYGIPMLFLSAAVTMFFGRLLFAIARKPISYRDSFVIAIHTQVLGGTLLLISTVMLLDMPLFYPVSLMLMGLTYSRLAQWQDQDH